jgi:hypothetical protein
MAFSSTGNQISLFQRIVVASGPLQEQRQASIGAQAISILTFITVAQARRASEVFRPCVDRLQSDQGSRILLGPHVMYTCPVCQSTSLLPTVCERESQLWSPQTLSNVKNPLFNITSIVASTRPTARHPPFPSLSLMSAGATKTGCP